MFPNLYFIIEGLFGVAPNEIFSVVQTFGLFLALTFILAGVALAKDMQRRTALGQFKPIVREKLITGNPSINDLITNGLIGFVLGFKLLYLVMNTAEFVDNPQDVLLSSKGTVVGGVLGALILMASKYWEKKQEAKKYKGNATVKQIIQPQEMVGDILIVAAISGLIGAKLFAVMEYPEQLMKDPIGQLFSGSGLAVNGGLIFGFLGVYLYSRKLGFKAIHVMDAAAPALILGQGFGRFGCHFSGDGDWGIVNTSPKPFSWLPDWLWSYTYPHNVNGQGVPMENCTGQYYTDKFCFELPEGVFPTSVYEIIILLSLFALLWFVMRKRITVPGVLFFWYLILSNFERFFIEMIRVNDRYEWFFNLSQAQIISVVLFFVGIAGVVILNNRAKRHSLA